MKYSIIIVGYKAVEHLERCLRSVAAAGLPPGGAEVILVDNSPEELYPQLSVKPSLVDRLIFNDGENLGFAAACNQGAAMASGEILVFLNPDTEVPATDVKGAWLETMAACLGRNRRGPVHVAAVGPLSDYVAGRQNVAQYRGKELPPEIPTRLLIGFCLMIKRTVFEELGGMDPDLFLGCDDLDLSWRLYMHGYGMTIAAGVFVKHAGSRSMNEDKAASRKLVEMTEDRFRAKLKAFYGEKVPTSEELWGCGILATELRPQTLSVCMILGNEPDVNELIGQAAAHAEEVVVVLTQGPRAEDFGPLPENVHLHSFAWVDDFAAARNYALSKCNMDWVLWLDADDEVPEHSWAQVVAALKKPGNLTALRACHFGFQVRNVRDDGSTMSAFEQGRLFPRRQGVMWEGRVHETYTARAAAAGLLYVPTDIELVHKGYGDAKTWARKCERNLRLLELEPPSAYKWYHIGCAHYSQNEMGAAASNFLKALAICPEEDRPLRDTIRYLLAVLCTHSGAWEEIPGLIEGSRKKDAVYLAGKYCLWAGDRAKAREHFERYLSFGPIHDPLGSNWREFRVDAEKLLLELKDAA